MVRVTMTKNKEGVYTGFSCLGHAGYAEAGADIVCAAVSALVINTLNSIETFTPDRPEVVQDAKTGRIECVLSAGYCGETKLLLDSLALGLAGIEEEYGKNYLQLKL